ncbi:hypothetical protein O9G_005052 [Rozella allomycis CSF55]|uniref:Uncharacterized protein n=1 Tax=Rozella allomycis (strain CSF55) TaxID=988480 RepID=A0A075ARR6_ROZAC|nr:hypothetical protein O9G_005052 [Rozella allomycis CSF55]|eukprot:EPZ32870.1 hypothetical protein O9G_005052 [Rozella allomycis CSF55]
MYGSENIPVNLKSEKGKIKDKKFVFKPLFQVKTEKGDQCVRHDASIGTCDDLSVFKPYKTKLSEMEREILIQPMTGKSDGQCVAFVDKSWKLEKCDTNSSKSFTEAQVFMNDKDPVNIEGSKYIFAFLGI